MRCRRFRAFPVLFFQTSSEKFPAKGFKILFLGLSPDAAQGVVKNARPGHDQQGDRALLSMARSYQVHQGNGNARGTLIRNVPHHEFHEMGSDYL